MSLSGRFFGLIAIGVMLFAVSGGVSAEASSEPSSAFIVFPLSMEETAVFPEVIEPGEKGVIITANIRHNDFKDTVENLKGIMHFSSPLKSVGLNTVEVGDLKPNVTTTLGFGADVSAVAKRGTYKLTLELIYDYLGNVGISQKFPVTVVVTGSPVLDLTDINIFPKTANPGDSVKIEAVVRNTGTYSSKNTFVSLEPIELAFGLTSAAAMPAMSSQVFIIPRSELKVFVGNLGVGESKTVSFMLDIDPSAVPSVYPLSLKVESEGISELELIALDVQGEPELTLATAETDIDKIVAGGDFSLSIQLDNIGSDGALATEVSVENDVGFLGRATAYVGTIDVDDSGSAIFDFSVPVDMEAGKKVLEVKVTYLDENREPHSMIKRVELFVFEAPQAADMTPILLVVAALVAGFFAFKFLQRRRKLRQIGVK
ncbi:MAG: hypothetical protein J7K00_04295 [Candidatus Diapherotrites archaeon]|nr:hypothetical protein [Candidatus Diapherotrites archaeon]